MTNQINITDNQPRKLSKIVLLSIIILAVLLGSCAIAYIYVQKEFKIAQQLANAQGLTNQGKWSEALLILNEVLAKDPNRIEAYKLRSSIYASSHSNDYTEQQNYYIYSIGDIDKMIELDPNNGNHHVDRDVVLRELAELPPDSATKFAIYELANVSAEKAMQLGVTSDYSYIYRHHARNLIESNHCEDGLRETQDLIDQTSPQDTVMSTYNIYLTEAYLCLNKPDKALKTAEQIQCDDPVSTCKSGFLAEIYYQMGEYDNALLVLNNMINSKPLGGGWRYFIRSAIYYDRGEKELALQDLTTGDNYSWYGNGVYWYVKAKMAFDEGDNQNGLLYLQYAETTLDVQYTPLRQKILNELKVRSSSPLTPSPQLPIGLTPIP